jgi:hypothetical protein
VNLDMSPHKQKGKAGYIDWVASLASPWVYVDYIWIRSIIKMAYSFTYNVTEGSSFRHLIMLLSWYCSLK